MIKAGISGLSVTLPCKAGINPCLPVIPGLGKEEAGNHNCNPYPVSHRQPVANDEEGRDCSEHRNKIAEYVCTGNPDKPD